MVFGFFWWFKITNRRSGAKKLYSEAWVLGIKRALLCWWIVQPTTTNVSGWLVGLLAVPSATRCRTVSRASTSVRSTTFGLWRHSSNNGLCIIFWKTHNLVGLEAEFWQLSFHEVTSNFSYAYSIVFGFPFVVIDPIKVRFELRLSKSAFRTVRSVLPSVLAQVESEQTVRRLISESFLHILKETELFTQTLVTTAYC